MKNKTVIISFFASFFNLDFGTVNSSSIYHHGTYPGILSTPLCSKQAAI